MVNNKKIMILGASVLQLPAIKTAKELGFQVIAVDKDKNAVGFESADICLEISTIDIPRVIAAAKEYKIDCIMTLATDMPIRTVAAVSKELNIVGISEETAIKVTDKWIMRGCLKEYNVPVPVFIKVNSYINFYDAIHKIKGKVIVKPVDSSGSKGVFLIEEKSNIEIIKSAYENSKYFSSNGEVIVEEFMDGPEVSVETLSFEGNVHIIAITDKLTTGAPRFVEMGHSQPATISDELKKQIEVVTIAAVKAVGINNGPSHTEIIITEQGPKIVELGARLGGDNITTHLVPLSTGIDMVKCCIDISMGIKPNLDRKFNGGSAIRYFNSDKGRILNIRGIDKVKEMPGVKEVYFTKGIGDTVGEVKSSGDRIGFVISQANTVIEATNICNSAKQKIYFEIENY
ncbi:ATP-grasp domain-containing protein [Psychrobacillus sp. OK032]|uniref:ATP-grasp domain-containing protein n=1 Tax=Psychrobacillus sp. OK032 TaxID=1884358 RepID=UPI0008D052E8|nr:ATP-grasp domain-containing protein [Psychrobacillus sp. OK032]SER70975.1 Biotin carboxylase [Psychrobacillus sp. OK032]